MSKKRSSNDRYITRFLDPASYAGVTRAPRRHRFALAAIIMEHAIINISVKT